MRNREVDAYIAKAGPFARPILERVRALFHQACPEVEEKIKWGAPFFDYKGLLGMMAAFKRHATFGLWRQKELTDPLGLFRKGTMAAGKFAEAAQLPADDVLVRYIREAVKLNEAGPARKPKAKPRPPPKAPDYFMAALRKNKKALAAFQAFPPSHKREYLEWVAEAKHEETRERRLATAVAWMSSGKPRNWKYMKRP